MVSWPSGTCQMVAAKLSANRCCCLTAVHHQLEVNRAPPLVPVVENVLRPRPTLDVDQDTRWNWKHLQILVTKNTQKTNIFTLYVVTTSNGINKDLSELVKVHSKMKFFHKIYLYISYILQQLLLTYLIYYHVLAHPMIASRWSWGL